MAGLNSAITSLDIEQKSLAKLRTWPWQPETLSGLVTAILLPVVLWLIERILAGVL